MVFMMTLNNLKEEALKDNIPIIRDATLEKISEIVLQNNIVNILEIGTAIGYSTVNLALLNKNIKIYSIEKDRQRFLKAKENICKFNLINQIKVVHADANNHMSKFFFKKYRDFIQQDQFDMIFIDAAKGQYINFLKKGIKFLKLDGYIIADNVLFKGYVLGEYNKRKYRTIVNNLRKFIDVLKDEEKFETDIFEIDDGLLVARLKKKF